MSSLVLVRHAQASFLKDDYDQLSDHGFDQAKGLGQYWVDQGFEFDELYVGPCKRHGQTADSFAEKLRQAGVKIPDGTILPGLDEHQVDQLVTRHFDALCNQLPSVQHLVESFGTTNWLQDPRAFQLVFQKTCVHWMNGEIEGLEVEPWLDFVERVNAAYDEILNAAGRSRRVVVVTSVGPITVMMWRALALQKKQAIEVGWRVRNTSLSEFLFSSGRVTLESFNSLPHLPQRHDWTYR